MDLAARPAVVSSAASDMLTLFVVFTEFWVSAYAPRRGRPGRALAAGPAALDSLYGAALDSGDVSALSLAGAGAMDGGETGFATATAMATPLLPARLLPLVRMFVRQLHYAANTPLADPPPGAGAGALPSSSTSALAMSGKVDAGKSGAADWFFSPASPSRLRPDRQRLDSSTGPVPNPIELEKAVAQVNELKRCALYDFVYLSSKFNLRLVVYCLAYTVINRACRTTSALTCKLTIHYTCTVLSHSFQIRVFANLLQCARIFKRISASIL